ncbi:hypothetical protein FB451DRAFT_1519128 [Mycena latifolia]|nr:hypothetical protein FB451DRAFT_1519128 [Mycena latifolia]
MILCIAHSRRCPWADTSESSALGGVSSQIWRADRAPRAPADSVHRRASSGIALRRRYSPHNRRNQWVLRPRIWDRTSAPVQDIPRGNGPRAAGPGPALLGMAEQPPAGVPATHAPPKANRSERTSRARNNADSREHHANPFLRGSKEDAGSFDVDSITTGLGYASSAGMLIRHDSGLYNDHTPRAQRRWWSWLWWVERQQRKEQTEWQRSESESGWEPVIRSETVSPRSNMGQRDLPRPPPPALLMPWPQT